MSEHNLNLPWRNDGPYPDVILDSSGEEIASFMNNDDCDYAVKAVNAHADLVRALENLANSVFESGLTAHNTEPWMAARAALAQAKALEQPAGAGE